MQPFQGGHIYILVSIDSIKNESMYPHTHTAFRQIRLRQIHVLFRERERNQKLLCQMVQWQLHFNHRDVMKLCLFLSSRINLSIISLFGDEIHATHPLHV